MELLKLEDRYNKMECIKDLSKNDRVIKVQLK